jgi:hypothetical protein
LWQSPTSTHLKLPLEPGQPSSMTSHTPPDSQKETRKLPGSKPQIWIRHVPSIYVVCTFIHRYMPLTLSKACVPLVEPLAFCSPWETHRTPHTHTTLKVLFDAIPRKDTHTPRLQSHTHVLMGAGFHVYYRHAKTTTNQTST